MVWQFEFFSSVDSPVTGRVVPCCVSDSRRSPPNNIFEAQSGIQGLPLFHSHTASVGYEVFVPQRLPPVRISSPSRMVDKRPFR